MKSADKLYNLLTNPFFISGLGFLLVVLVSLTGSPIGIDESNWNYTGKIWAEKGLIPYRDITTNKAPGIFILHVLSYKLFGPGIWFPRLVAAVFIFLTTLLIYYLVLDLSRSPTAASLSGLIFTLIMPLYTVDGVYSETETFMNLFRLSAFVSIWLVYRSGEKKVFLKELSAGLFLGAAISFKQIAVFDILALVFANIYIFRGNLKKLGFYLAIFSAGILTALLLSAAPLFWSGGTMDNYMDGVWKILFASSMISGGVLGRISGFARNFFEINIFPVAIGSAGFVFFRKQLQKSVRFAIPLLVWALTDFAAYNAQGQYFNHHRKVFIMSWSIIFGLVAGFIIDRSNFFTEASHRNLSEQAGKKKITMAAIFLLLLFYVPFQSDYYSTARNILKGWSADGWETLGYRVRDLTSPEDYIYVWGEHGGPIYFYSNRFSPTRQFFESLLSVRGAVDEARRDILIKKPRLVLVPIDNPAGEWLNGILKDNYFLVEENARHNIYKIKTF